MTVQHPVAPTVQSNFVKQQGFDHVPDGACSSHFSALNFQPRVLGPLVALGLIMKSSALFLALGVFQWWNALLPAWNPFDHVYNLLFAGRGGRPKLTPAPAPRRFSMGMAGSFMLGIGASLAMGWSAAALVLEIFLSVALAALLFGSFCLGSTIFHILKGRAAFARQTLPWARG